MDKYYDVIVCGTGLKECILSGLLSTSGKKVLHLDVNDFYGGESASFTLKNLLTIFNQSDELGPEWGHKRDWNIDLIPKFIMANGKLVKILIKTTVKDYIQFQSISGCFVYQPREAGWITAKKCIHKVPASENEVLSSSLIPLTEKLRGRQFFQLIATWNINDPKTWGVFDPKHTTMQECYDYYSLSADIRDFVGHAIGLEHNDCYLNLSCGEFLQKLKLYLQSLLRYGKSPFIYPIYGLSTLPEGFSRLCAVHGGTFILRAHLKSIECEDNGVVKGIVFTDGTKVDCGQLICSPDYLKFITQKKEKIRIPGKIVRVISVSDHLPRETSASDNCQLIFPQKQLGRNNDVYMAVLSSQFGICPEGFYVSIVSSLVETDDPLAELEIPLSFLVGVKKQFVKVSDVIEVLENSFDDNIFVTASYDASSHFEEATEEVLKLWKAMTGEDLDLDNI